MPAPPGGRRRFPIPARSGPAAATPLTGGVLFQNTGLRSAITFPQVIALGFSRRLDDRLTLLADIDWTGWSSLQQLTLDFANPLQPDQSLPLHWSDSFRVALGGIYRLDDTLDLRSGISWDQTPISTTFRNADLPDSDEIIVSAGFSWRVNAQWSVTMSYSYGSFASAPVHLAIPGAGTLAGTFQRHTNALALQARVGL